MKKPLHLPYYLPAIGIFIFFGLYLYASFLYSGGSAVHPEKNGFDWLHNYWCDLMGTEGINGTFNPARPVAIGATVFIAIALGYFVYLFPKYLPVSPFWDQLTRISGVGAVFLTIWIFTSLHDYVIIVASILGLFTVIGIFKGLLHHQLTFHVGIAVFCFILIAINNILYYGNFLYGLPLLQKITFIIVLTWLAVLNIRFKHLST